MDTAKLFTNGRSQAVRLPKEYRFEGNQVYIKKIGRAVILLPATESWQVLIESLDQFSADFLADRTQPVEQQREPLFA